MPLPDYDRSMLSPAQSDPRAQGSWFRVQCSGFRVPGSGFRVPGFRVPGSGFRVQASGFRVSGSGFRVLGSGFRVSGFLQSAMYTFNSESAVIRVLGSEGLLRVPWLGFQLHLILRERYGMCTLTRFSEKTTPYVKSLRSGDTTPCRMTRVNLRSDSRFRASDPRFLVLRSLHKAKGGCLVFRQMCGNAEDVQAREVVIRGSGHGF